MKNAATLSSALAWLLLFKISLKTRIIVYESPIFLGQAFIIKVWGGGKASAKCFRNFFQKKIRIKTNKKSHFKQFPMKQLAFLLLWWKLMTHLFICQVHKGELTHFAGSFHYIKQCTLQIELQSSEKILYSRDYNFKFSCVYCSIEKHWICVWSPFSMSGSEILMHCYIKRLISACMWLLDTCMK